MAGMSIPTQLHGYKTHEYNDWGIKSFNLNESINILKQKSNLYVLQMNHTTYWVLEIEHELNGTKRTDQNESKASSSRL